MSAPSFVPLACPLCLAELVGRAADIVAFCPPCGIAVRVDGEESLELSTMVVAVRLPNEGSVFSLPFWSAGGLIVPAFRTARPLTLARMATGLLGAWKPARGLAAPPPLGARLGPESLAELAGLARLEAPPPDATLSLVGVPALLRENRVYLPALRGTLYPGDVSEQGALVHAAQGLSEPTRV